MVREKAIPALYDTAREKVEDALQSTESIVLTCDGWTSLAPQSYVAVTAILLITSGKFTSN